MRLAANTSNICWHFLRSLEQRTFRLEIEDDMRELMAEKPSFTSVRPCPQCNGPSYVCVIVPSNIKPAHDEVLYECRMCGHPDTVYVEQV